MEQAGSSGDLSLCHFKRSVLACGSGGCATFIIVLLTFTDLPIFTQTTKSLSFLFFNYNNKPHEAMSQ